MTAEIVSVGTELLLGQIIDTHAPTMARILAECGIACKHRATVGDNLDRIVETLRQALSRADVVVTIGGLGPTSDDLTRDAIAVAMDDTLETVEEIEQKLRRWFAQNGYQWVESNARQAQKPTCAEIIPNPNGTAPGLVCRKNGKTVFALPGPRGEFDPMAYDQVKPMLETLGGQSVIHSRVLRVIGVGESSVEEKIQHLMDAENPTVAPYAQTGEVHLRITAKSNSKEEAEALIDPVEQQVRAALGDAVYGTDLTDLESALIQLLTARGETLAVAESMTGGGLGKRLTSIEGASNAFRGGVLVYNAQVKDALLGIGPIVDEFGPVSEECAKAMAESIRNKLNTTYAISITGNAGATSDTGGKPRGRVYIGIVTPHGTSVHESSFRGIRDDIRTRAEQVALMRLRELVLKQA
jgi:nicotinamide-nucleotide amidase